MRHRSVGARGNREGALPAARHRESRGPRQRRMQREWRRGAAHLRGDEPGDRCAPGVHDHPGIRTSRAHSAMGRTLSGAPRRQRGPSGRVAAGAGARSGAAGPRSRFAAPGAHQRDDLRRIWTVGAPGVPADVHAGRSASRARTAGRHSWRSTRRNQGALGLGGSEPGVHPARRQSDSAAHANARDHARQADLPMVVDHRSRSRDALQPQHLQRLPRR